MRRWLTPLVVLVVLLAGGLWYHQQLQRTRTGFPAPDFVLRDLEGKPHRLSNLRGKVVLLNVWATWCEPCREEMPSMEVLHRAMAGRDFAVLAASQDEDGLKAVRPFVDELGLTFPVLIDRDGEVARKFGVTGYPETFIIDKDGTVIVHYIGYKDWSDERLRTLLKQLIAAKRDAGHPPA